jgi:hypothetical protein
MSGTFCSNCGSVLSDESGGLAPERRKPCPKCGSMARTFHAEMTGGITAGGSAAVSFIPFEEKLLTDARRQLDGGEFSIAVVVAHMACEVGAERALSRAWSAKGLTYLEDAVESFLNGFNLANDRIRNLYVSLTGRRIQDQPFWSAFKVSSKRRNDIIHGGHTAGKAEAEDSLKAATEVVAYLK